MMQDEHVHKCPSISVCVPVYNTDVRNLAYSLINQLNDTHELILIDDASQEKYKEINAELKQQAIQYIELKENIGRSKIRNLFTQYAQHDFLLFIDCDSQIIDHHYIQKYQQAIRKNTQVIFGGHAYPTKCPSSKQRLAWYIGKTVENRTASQRRKHPNKSFMTNNFLVKRTLLVALPFDERITSYGHEDTLYGIEIQRHQKEIQHIDNPILNAIMDSNIEYMNKVEASIESLIKIRAFYEHEKLLVQSVKLLRFATQIERFHLVFIMRISYLILGKIIRNYHTSTMPISLRLLDFYKIIYFFSNNKRKTKSKVRL